MKSHGESYAMALTVDSDAHTSNSCELAGCRRTHWHARKHSPVTRLLASSSHIQPEAASSHVAPPTVQLLLSELAAVRDRVGSLEKELTNIFMGGESVVHSVDQHLEMDDSDHRAELEGSSLQVCASPIAFSLFSRSRSTGSTRNTLPDLDFQILTTNICKPGIVAWLYCKPIVLPSD